MQLFTACFYIFFIFAIAAEAALPDAVATIYVDDSNGNQIATGSGVIIADNGLIVTDIHLLLAWLGAEDNSLFVRAGENGYYPIETLIHLERDFDIAFFSISADGLNIVVPASDYNYAMGEKIYIAGDNKGFKTKPVEGTVKGIHEDGVIELSVPTFEGLRGALVLNSRGEATGMVAVREDTALAIPISRALELASGGTEKVPASSVLNGTSIKKAKAAVESNRASAEDYLRLGVAYEKASDYAEAYHGLGIAYAGEGMYEEAAEALEQAIRINPNYAKALGNLGFLYDYLGRHEEAISSFARAIELKPEYAEAYNGLGVSYAKEKNYEEAIEAFRSALRIRPEFKKARFNLGLSYVSLGDKKSALHEEVLLRQLDPKMAGKLLELIPVEDEDKETDEEEIADDGDGDDA
jgi:tetratricopeptide (TPR) repeat protein